MNHLKNYQFWLSRLENGEITDVKEMEYCSSMARSHFLKLTRDELQSILPPGYGLHYLWTGEECELLD